MRWSLLAPVLVFLGIVMVACTSPGSVAANPAKDLFTKHGWSIVGEVQESTDKLPADFQLHSLRFPWHVYLDLSSDVGLDFNSYAGQEVKTLRFDVKDTKGGRLADIEEKYRLQGMVLMNGEDRVIGSWITYTSKDGVVLLGMPGYSLNAKDLVQVTGLTWPEYSQKHYARTE